MPKILLVDEDSDARKNLRELLVACHHIVHEARDGSEAKNLISKDSPDLIITEVDMPNLNGIELLDWAKTNTQAPVILISSRAHILDANSALDLGAKAYFLKPIGKEELKIALDAILLAHQSQPKPHQNETLPSELYITPYFTVFLEEILEKKQVEYPVFVKLNDNQYSKIITPVQIPPRELLNSYRHKGMHILFALRSDFYQIIGCQKIKNLSENLTLKSELRTQISQSIITHILPAELKEVMSEFVVESLNYYYSSSEDLATHIEKNLTHANLLQVKIFHSLLTIAMAFKMNHISSPLFHKINAAIWFCDMTIESLRLCEILPSDVLQVINEIKKIKQDLAPSALFNLPLHPLSKMILTTGPLTQLSDAKMITQHIQSINPSDMEPVSLLALQSLFPTSL